MGDLLSLSFHCRSAPSRAITPERRCLASSSLCWMINCVAATMLYRQKYVTWFVTLTRTFESADAGL